MSTAARTALCLAVVLSLGVVPVAAAEEAPPPTPPVTVPLPTPVTPPPTPRPDPQPVARPKPAPVQSTPRRLPRRPRVESTVQPRRQPVAPVARAPRVKRVAERRVARPAPRVTRAAKRPPKRIVAPRASEPRPPRDLAEPRPRHDLAELTWTSPAIRGEPTSSGTGQSETFPPFALAILAALLAAAAVIARALGSLRPALTVPPAPPFPAVASAGGSSSLAAIVDTAATATARELMPFERAAETNSLPTYEPPVAVGAAAEEWAHCEIRWWRGYVKSQFYAAAPDDEATALCHSPAFRWRHDFPPPETEEAIAAHRALIDRLLAEGWELDGRRADWYADTLRQRQQLESGT